MLGGGSLIIRLGSPNLHHNPNPPWMIHQFQNHPISYLMFLALVGSLSRKSDVIRPPCGSLSG